MLLLAILCICLGQRYAIFEFLVYVFAVALVVVAFGFALFIAQNVVASLPRCHSLCFPASSGNRVINAWNFHNRNEFPAAAASQARKHARNPLTIHQLPSPPPSSLPLPSSSQVAEWRPRDSASSCCCCCCFNN